MWPCPGRGLGVPASLLHGGTHHPAWGSCQAVGTAGAGSPSSSPLPLHPGLGPAHCNELPRSQLQEPTSPEPPASPDLRGLCPASLRVWWSQPGSQRHPQPRGGGRWWLGVEPQLLGISGAGTLAQRSRPVVCLATGG